MLSFLIKPFYSNTKDVPAAVPGIAWQRRLWRLAAAQQPGCLLAGTR
jgi:hypothetical protein